MASPFRHFRKYTGLMMALLGALLMFAFVVAEPLMQYMRGSGGGPAGSNKVAVSWNGGEFTDEQLGNLVQRRRVLATFLQQVEQMGYMTALKEGNLDPRPIVARLPLPSTLEQGVERDVVNTRIFANAARDAGIVVSDEAIRKYLTDLGLGKVSKGQMRAMLKGMSGGQRGISIDLIFDLLRDAMLARNFDQSFLFTSSTIMPQQRWRDWRRVNDRIIVEAAEVPVSNFLAEVPEPTEEELAQFFEEHKENLPVNDRVNGVELPSPTPAFAEPQRVVLQYIKADLLTQVDAFMEDVTEEEIADYYQENKDQFIRSDALLGDDDSSDMEESLFEEDDAEGDMQGDTETDSTDDSTEDSEEADSQGDMPAADESTAVESATEESAAEESTADEAPGDEADDGAGDDADDSEPAEPSESQSGSLTPANPFRLVAMQTEGQTPEESPEEAAEEAPGKTTEETTEETTGEPAAEPADASSDEAADMAAETEAADDPPTESSESLFDDIDAGATDMLDDPSLGEADGSGDAEPQVEYQPLEEVKDEIRRQIATQKATGQQLNRMAELVAPIKDAYDNYSIALADAEADAGDEPVNVPVPEALKNLEAYAQEKELEFAETADLSYPELRDSSIGKTAVPAHIDPRSQRPLPLFFVTFAQDLSKLWEPELSYDSESNGYIVIKTKSTPYRVPKLEEIRAQVVRSWKLQKAADLAMERAKEIAEKAEPQGLSLKDYLAGEPGVKVVVTDPFSWFTTGQVPPTSRQIPVQMSTPEPIVAAGNEFMKTAFDLEAGKLGTALNHDKSIAYVIRVVQHMETPQELRSAFTGEGQLMHRLYGFEQAYRQQIGAALIRELLGKSDLDWKREPDQLRRDDRS